MVRARLMLAPMLVGFALLTGCGSGGDSQPPPESSIPTQTPATESSPLPSLDPNDELTADEVFALLSQSLPQEIQGEWDATSPESRQEACDTWRSEPEAFQDTIRSSVTEGLAGNDSFGLSTEQIDAIVNLYVGFFRANCS